MVQDIARQNRLVRVTGVVLVIGGFAGVEPQSLHFAWEVLRKGTIAEDAVLEIETAPILLRCAQCECEYAVSLEDMDMECPVCEGSEYEVLSGRQMDLKSIMGETDDGTH
jgi:hydrogenase nickel incorporation protein HypA/HybF